MKKFERKTVFIYEINGQEKIKVSDPEEALYWDVVFDVAEQVDQLLIDDPPDLKLDEAQRTELSLYIAKKREELVGVMADRPAPEPGAQEEEKAAKGEEPAKEKSSSSNDSKQSDSKVKKQPFVQEFNRPVEPSKDGFSL